MHLLITRPEPDAEATAARLRALGHEVTVQPLLTIAFSPPPVDLPMPQALVMTSRNGVRAVRSWPHAVEWRKLPVFVTGSMTAEEARTAGFTDVRYGSGDAGDLARLIRANLSSGSGLVLYAAARDRSGNLINELTGQGYDVRVVEAYRADPAPRFEPPVREALVSGTIDGALFYSRRTAETFRNLATAEGITERLAGVSLYALSEQVAEGLAGLEPRAIKVSAKPTEDSLLALIPSR